MNTKKASNYNKPRKSVEKHGPRPIDKTYRYDALNQMIDKMPMTFEMHQFDVVPKEKDV